ncbi:MULTISPECIES: radical SAM family heme chaperone HemW [Allobacillus]|uniref:Heme chaperone HemW n=1 Tax=Allobacillus halotolerans TaxID=570278 RepID=A0ABS6GPX7_9BACI|nr:MULTISPECIES: radical SAM family heme chaperone HemW [Allobacillus]MBU6080705.1 radical SAM family heme chaperone HemW [Allobacillus halotolerans]TSJ68256.1 oxygen-independent coproporphyrinogen III oxidase [Allobacillus sp. SKP2-8]
MTNAAYIHIPFCHEICHYCDFAKMYYNQSLADDYLKALDKEMELYIGKQPKTVRTIYIGGGTPTSLNPEQLTKLMTSISTYFNVDEVEEFTIEANPGEFTEDHVKVMKEFGVNRVSLGVQVLDDAYLKQLNRLHTVEDVNKAVHSLERHDLTNISMDFIYALPDQSLEHFKQTLNQAIAYDLPHYSSYALQIEPRTVFHMRHQQGKLNKPPEETEADMLIALMDMMESNGLNHYEISNYAKKGFESQHNLTYWSNAPYYAFGSGAHGYLNDERYVNYRPVNHYIQAINDRKKPILHIDEITKKEKIEEEMFLGLRRRSGVSDSLFQQKYGVSLFDVYGKEIKRLSQKEWVEYDKDTIRMTRQGLMFGNEVFSSFLLDENQYTLIDS